MEALANKVRKQRENIPQHSYISHNHPYISSSDIVGTISIFTATYVEMVMPVKCSNVWNGLSLVICMYFVSQS